MGVTLTTQFLFGVTVGVLLVVLSKPLTRVFGQVMRYLPLLLMIGTLLFVLFLWLRG